jgi:hypothetical protein
VPIKIGQTVTATVEVTALSPEKPCATPRIARKGLFDINRVEQQRRAGPETLFEAASLSACCRTYLPTMPKVQDRRMIAGEAQH